MFETLIASLPSLALVLAVTIAALLVFRQTYIKNLGEMQEKLIAAQIRQIKRLDQENTAMRVAFKELGVEIEIDGTTITIINGQQPRRKRIVQVPVVDNPEP